MREFEDFGAFAAHMNTVADTLPLVNRLALGPAADAVRTEARSILGHYQGEDAGTPAWQPLSASTMKSRERQGFSPNEPLLASGQLRDSIQSSEDGPEAVVGSAEARAVWQELGTAFIPARPFLAKAGARLSEQVGQFMADVAVSHVAGKPVGRSQSGFRRSSYPE